MTGDDAAHAMTAPEGIATMPAPHSLDPDGQDLTATELAKMLRLSRRTMLRYLDAGLIPGAWKLEQSGWRIPQAAVIEYVRSRTRDGS